MTYFRQHPEAAIVLAASIILIALAVIIIVNLVAGRKVLNMRFLVVGVFAGFLGIIFTTVVLPQVTFHPKPSAWKRDYTAKEWRGRKIYIREGCWYCHTQFVRVQDQNLGPVSQPGDFVHETPHLLGTERTGPDLSNEGGKFPNAWHLAHLRDPRSVSPGSIMPSFAYLSVEELNDLTAYLQSLGPMGRKGGYIPHRVDQVKMSMKEISKLVEEAKARHNPLEPDVPGPYQVIEYGHPQKEVKKQNPISFDIANIGIGRGIFQQNCLACHGPQGHGDGTAGKFLTKKPANFSLPQFDTYSDQKWFFRVSEGVPGTIMPQWKRTLTDEQRWYVINYLKFLAAVPDDGWAYREKVK